MWRVLSLFFGLLNRFVVWHRLPVFLSVVNIIALQSDLRRRNIFTAARVREPAPDKGDRDIRGARTADGSYNDLADPAMGMAMTCFGRNVKLKYTYGENPQQLLMPNPRVISNVLLARERFLPVPHLNLMVAAWLQFMTHDWFSHGDGDAARPIDVPVPKGDAWDGGPGGVEGHIRLMSTLADPRASEADRGMPATFRNHETHWWDGSQIYGSSAERIRQMRSDPAGNLLPGGRVYIDAQGHLGIDPKNNIELAGFNTSWWVGISVMTNIFIREHNIIAAHLALEHPDKSGDWLFEKARLVNAALMAKIHAVEWTPALLNTPALRFAMRGNWWGLLGEEYERAFGRRQGRAEYVGGVPGSTKDDHGTPYAMTEEFVAVYRMHPLLPDELSFRRLHDNSLIEVRPLEACVNLRTREVYANASLADVIYSFATMNIGALRLNNYPSTLRRLPMQGAPNQIVDLAAVDIVRDRERGVPRYCEMRRQLRMRVPRSFKELAGGDSDAAKRLAEVYEHVEDVDLLVGCLAEPLPTGFGISDTAFRIFILMATRRLKSDRFFTDDFNEQTYTPRGMQWVRDNGFASVLARHFPEVAPKVGRVRNAFFPWPKD